MINYLLILLCIVGTLFCVLVIGAMIGLIVILFSESKFYKKKRLTKEELEK